ncbi:hypothetical protein BJ741DRAFT_607775 [Chytriomyces cf. hyalinus JEL632]|nr:hypothetical protein BJ741DRAFT_607775 [Chytriomyces cf. hyalinus JEL632]
MQTQNMQDLSAYSCVCIAVTIATLTHLAGVIIFIVCSQETRTNAPSGSSRPAFMSSFNINLIIMIASLLLTYGCETYLYIASDYGAVSQMTERVLVTGRTVWFLTAEIGYINNSYSRAKGIFEQTLLPAIGAGLYYVVKTVPLLFLPAMLFRMASFVVHEDNASLIFSVARWYGAGTAVVAVLLDIVFLVSFVLFRRANSLNERATSSPDDSLLIVARYGTAGSFLFLTATVTLFAYTQWISSALRMASLCQLSIILFEMEATW